MERVIACIVVILILLSILFYLVQKRVLNQVALYTYTNPQEVFHILEKPLVRLCIPKRDRLLMKISPLIMMDREEELESVIDELDGMKLSEQNEIGLNQKLLEYYASKNRRAKAEQKYQSLIRVLKNEPYSKDPKYTSIRCEAEQLEQIYVHRNKNYLDEEIKLAENAPTGAARAIYYYRCARLCFYRKEYEDMKKYLQTAQSDCKGSRLHDHIQKILDGEFERIEEM